MEEMITGIGIDLVSIPRTERLLKRWGQRFLEKVFTAREIKAGLARPWPAQEFAAWFGAKEALMKALGQGIMAGVRFRQIEVTSHARHGPEIRLFGKAHEIAESKGVKEIHLSLSHERGPTGSILRSSRTATAKDESGGYAVAAVVLVGRESSRVRPS
jgi:holo-[acyl-carrier protein] synthase